MKSILSVIWKYKAFSLIFVLIVIASIVIVNFLHNKLHSKQKKYIFTTFLFIISAVLFVLSFLSILSKYGLVFLMLFVFVFSTAVICLSLSMILDTMKPIVVYKKNSGFRTIIDKFDRLVEESRSNRRWR